MKILVTGGAGFVGRHFVNLLLNNGHEVVALDNLTTSRNGKSRNAVYYGSILDRDLMDKLISQVDYVVHFAAVVGVVNIIKSPLLTLQTNIIGSEIVLSTSTKYVKPVLLISSSEIYGKNTADLLDEDSDRIVGGPQKTRWAYSDSKAVEESFGLAYHSEFGLPVKIARLFNTAGPGQLGNYGMVIPRFIDCALNNKDIEIYGDGNQTRCFMHVSDAVHGLYKFMKIPNLNGQVLNLGNPTEISIKDLAIKIITMTNSKSKIKFIPHKDVFGENFEDMVRRVPNIEKAINKLNWRPLKNLDDIIKDICKSDQEEL